MKNVVLTGSEGTVGRVLTGRSLVENEQPRLSANITRVDIGEDKGGTNYPFLQSDLKDRELIKQLLQTHDVFIHAAWNTQEGILHPEVIDPENLETARRILECAEELGERATAKVVLLSSVNAHVPSNWRERRASAHFIDITEDPQPNQHNRGSEPGDGLTGYGQSKISIENAARRSSEKGLHIVVPRLGGVNPRDLPSSQHDTHQDIYADPKRGKHFDAAPHGWEDATRLRHADLVSDLQEIIDTPRAHSSFKIYNLVSDTPDRVHKLKSSK